MLNSYISIQYLFFLSLEHKRYNLLTVFKMEFVVSNRGKIILIFDWFKYVFSYTSQTNVTRWRCFMKNCRANIFEKEKVILATKRTFFIYE
jgi:hypothetical protein